MASSFLEQKAMAQAEKLEKKYGSSAYGGTTWLKEQEKKRKKKKKEEEDDIAPVRTTTEEDDGFDFFQKGRFDDGYQFGDVTGTILGTVGDIGTGIVKGASKMVGGVLDAGAYGVAGIADYVGADEFADELRVKARENVIDNAFKDWDEYINQSSVLGRTSDAIAEGLGQVASIILTGGAAAGAGLGAVGTTAATTGMMGVSSFGSGVTEAYEGGATDEEAAVYGLIKGVVDAGSEMIFGGLGKTVKALGISKGLTSLDDVFAQKLAGKIANQTAKNFVEFGVKASAEGVEEVLAGIGSAVGKKLTYMEEKELRELIEDENLLEQFVVGAVTSGISQSGIVPGMRHGSLVETTTKGQDFISGITESDQKVVDRLVEQQIAEKETDGKKLSKKEKNEVYDDIIESLERGEISLDTIAEVIDGDSYKAYKDMVAEEEKAMQEIAELYKGDELQTELANFMEHAESQKVRSELDEKVFGLVKNGKLAESYYERGRRGQSYRADLSKYDEKQKATIQNAINSGILNNTRRTHEFVDLIAKISADKGVLFDFTSNEKLKGSIYAVGEGKTVNGFVTESGVTLNINSAKALNSVVGHEITHVLEGTELYNELQSALFEYAKSRKATDSNFDSEYKERLYNTRQLYKSVEGYEGVEGFNKIKNEVVADLVGDYLFTDADFVNHLVKNRNVFQKIWDEIKYLHSIAKAGSKEEKQLLEVKRAFEKAYKEGGKAQSDTKYSVSTENNISKTLERGEMENNIYIKDGHTESGETVNFIDLILDGKKKGETRNHKSLTRKWVGMAKDGMVYGRVRFGDPIEITNKSPEYQDAYIAGTEYDLKDGESKYYYPVLEIEDLRDNPRPVTRNGNYGQYRYSLSDSDGRQLSKEQQDVKVMDGGSVAKYSLSTWTPDTQNKVRANLIKAGYDGDRVDKWIKDANSVASVIAADKDRLDFEAADNQTMLKNNQEYVKTLDASTLCAKRLLYQGTFDAIQHRMPNTMLSSDDLISLLNMMKEHGVQTPCGVCYVESRRRHLGKFAQEWLDGYDGEYKPNLDEVTTSDGLEALRKSHPVAYEDFINAMKKKGSANPKVVQLRTEYRNEIMSLTPAQIRKIESIGGLRVQSFSDFETPHLLDMMQAVMDMSAKGLTSQAYTKVPNFAWVFGDTGIKINLSLIAEGDGFDSDGNLAFSSVEGMDIEDAMKLRDAYSENVGTIIVGANDKHILACMADDRIDFIIPFHRSGWGQNELDMMGMSSYTDYTYGQKEHDLQTGKGVANLYPPDYWDYTLSGKENAERYLNLCAKTGREPKFSHFLVNNGDGSYSLQPDGSTDGYWKTLIDFKMYDNEGNGVAQRKVQPNFNMEEAYRVLAEYEGGANKLPVANDVVEEFVAKHQSGTLHSLSHEGEAPIRRSNFDVYGEDIKLESAPVQEEVVSKVETATESAPVGIAPTGEDDAPISEEIVEDVAPTGDVEDTAPVDVANSAVLNRLNKKLSNSNEELAKN
jgi:hypothetical protein